MPAGQPRAYTPDELREKVEQFKKAVLADEEKPTLIGFVVFCNIRRATIYNYKCNPEYKEIIADLEGFIESQFISKSLDGDYNSTIAKLCLSHNHGYTEKQEIDNKGELTLKIAFVDTPQVNGTDDTDNS